MVYKLINFQWLFLILNYIWLKKQAADCGVELKKHNVTMISLYPGAVNTEIVVSKKLGKV